MAVTSFDKCTGLWLTMVSEDAKPGDEITLSFSHPLLASQFTTYRLGDVLGTDRWGCSLFDLEEPDTMIKVGDRFQIRSDLVEIRKDHAIRSTMIDGVRYDRCSGGDFVSHFSWPGVR